MTIRLQLVVGAVMVLAILGILGQVHSRKLNLRDALIWLFVSVIVLVLDICPSLLAGLTILLGVELPVNMLLFLGFCFCLVLLFGLTVKVSRQSDEIKRLTQEIAILEHKLEEK